MFFDIRVDSVALNALRDDPRKKYQFPRDDPAQRDSVQKREHHTKQSVTVEDCMSIDDIKRLVFKAIYFVVLHDTQLKGVAKVKILDTLCINIHLYTSAELVAYLHQAITKLWRQGLLTKSSYTLLEPLNTYHTKLQTASESSSQSEGGALLELYTRLHSKHIDTLAE